MTLRYFICGLLVFVLGCSDNDNNSRSGKSQNSVFDTQIEALEKAKSVEDQIQDAAAKQQQVIKDQTD